MEILNKHIDHNAVRVFALGGLRLFTEQWQHEREQKKYSQKNK